MQRSQDSSGPSGARPDRFAFVGYGRLGSNTNMGQPVMPFAYYGAKHGLASKYPRPVHDTIIEPFAGAAGYSTHWAPLGRHVLLNDLNADVVALWRRLQTITAEDLDAIEATLGDERTTEILIATSGGSSAWEGICRGRDRAITPRMRDNTPSVLARIAATLAHLKQWNITHGSYTDLPDIEATWLIDPPYQPLISTAGNDYTTGASGIDYQHLAEWCKSRKGQVIVCEQSPAQWLPFTHLAHQQNGSNTGQSRSEVVWLSDQQQGQLFEESTG
jgi:site-specific DNA-adenine methylase